MLISAFRQDISPTAPQAPRNEVIYLRLTEAEAARVSALSPYEQRALLLSAPVVDEETVAAAVAAAKEQVRLQREHAAARRAARRRVILAREGISTSIPVSRDDEEPVRIGRRPTIGSQDLRTTTIGVSVDLETLEAIKARSSAFRLGRSDYARRLLVGLSAFEIEPHVSPTSALSTCLAAQRFATAGGWHGADMGADQEAPVAA